MTKLLSTSDGEKKCSGITYGYPVASENTGHTFGAKKRWNLSSQSPRLPPVEDILPLYEDEAVLLSVGLRTLF